MEETRKRVVTRIETGKIEEASDSLVVEKEITITLGEETRLHAICTPSHLEALAYGYLVSEGWIRSAQDIVLLTSHENGFVVELRDGVPTSVAVPRPLETSFTLSTDVLLTAAKECLNRGIIFRETGGTHAAALGDRSEVISFFEDISRSCALEKVLGYALLRGVAFDETFIFLSSRLPKRMLQKIARCGIPIVGAVSAPTFDAVEEAERLGICVCGFVREHRLNVYSHGWRLG
jgi:FdhD protein